MNNTSQVKEICDFVKEYPVHRLRKGQTILYQGEVPRQVHIVKSGVVKIYNINNLGEERIISFATDNDLIPAAWIFNKSTVALYYYDAFSDCELIAVPKSEFLEILNTNQAAMHAALDRFVTLYVGATVHINAVEHSKSVDKIVHTLHQLMMRFGEEQAPKLYRINLRLTHQDFANMIGLTRETIATELAKLKKQKVISYFGQRYMIRVDKLQQLLGEDNFSNLKI